MLTRRALLTVGVASASASGDLALRLGKCWVGGAGYRTLQVDFDKGDVLGTRRVFDMAYSGPRLWIVYTW